MYVNMRAHVRYFFSTRWYTYISTIIHACCGLHSEHECNPRALPFKEVDTRNPISPNDIAIARDEYLRIIPLFTHPDLSKYPMSISWSWSCKNYLLIRSLNYSEMFTYRNTHLFIELFILFSTHTHMETLFPGYIT